MQVIVHEEIRQGLFLVLFMDGLVGEAPFKGETGYEGEFSLQAGPGRR
jgi:hypothetical protein